MFGVIELGTEHVDESTEGRLSRRLVVLRSPDLEIVVVTCGGHREEAPHTVRIEGSDAVPGEHCRVVAKYKRGKDKVLGLHCLWVEDADDHEPGAPAGYPAVCLFDVLAAVTVLVEDVELSGPASSLPEAMAHELVLPSHLRTRVRRADEGRRIRADKRKLVPGTRDIVQTVLGAIVDGANLALLEDSKASDGPP